MPGKAFMEAETLVFPFQRALPLFRAGLGTVDAIRPGSAKKARQPTYPLEEIMKIQKLIVAIAALAATASALAQQTEFTAPDAGVKLSLTRAEVRQEMHAAYGRHAMVQQQHTGQDPVYAKSQRSRAEVRAEAAEAARQFHAGDATSPYFG
jgi:hypothetical protein